MLLGAPASAEGGLPPEHLLTVREAAERLRVRPVTVYKLCADGRLAHARISNAIRIARLDLDAFIASCAE